MKRNVVFGIVALVGLAAGIAAWYRNDGAMTSEQQSLFKGQPLSHWMEQARKAFQDGRKAFQDAPKDALFVLDRTDKAFEDLASSLAEQNPLKDGAEVVSLVLEVLESERRPTSAVLAPLYYVAGRDPRAAVPAFPLLKKLALNRQEQKLFVRQMATGMVGNLAGEVPEAVPFLLELLTDEPDEDVRLAAVVGVGRPNQSKTVTSRLIQLLSDPNPQVREAAARGLQFADPAPEVISALEKACSDSTHFVRSMAESMLLNLKQRQK